MNFLLSLLLCAVSVVATAQHARRSTTSTGINDDGKTLSVRVEGQIDGRIINYQHTFDVARLSGPAKDDLKRRIFDSLGIGNAPTSPVSPAPPDHSDPHQSRTAPGPVRAHGPSESQVDLISPPNVTFRCETCTGKIKLTLTRSTDDYSFERDTKIDPQKRFFPYQLALPPGQYRLTYSQNDVLQIQSTFTVRAGEENTVIVK